MVRNAPVAPGRCLCARLCARGAARGPGAGDDRRRYRRSRHEGLDAATVVGEGLTDDPRALTEALAVAERAELPLVGLYAGARRLTTRS